MPKFPGDELSELLGGVGNALAFSVHDQFDRRQWWKPVLRSELADIRTDRATWKYRDRKAGEDGGAQAGDAVAHRTDRPLQAGGAECLERVVAVNASLREYRQRQRLSRFRPASDGGDPYQRFKAHQFPAPELRLVRHQRDIEFISLQRGMKMDAAGAAQLDFHIRMRAR